MKWTTSKNEPADIRGCVFLRYHVSGMVNGVKIQDSGSKRRRNQAQFKNPYKSPWWETLLKCEELAETGLSIKGRACNSDHSTRLYIFACVRPVHALSLRILIHS